MSIKPEINAPKKAIKKAEAKVLTATNALLQDQDLQAQLLADYGVTIKFDNKNSRAVIEGFETANKAIEALEQILVDIETLFPVPAMGAIIGAAKRWWTGISDIVQEKALQNYKGHVMEILKLTDELAADPVDQKYAWSMLRKALLKDVFDTGFKYVFKEVKLEKGLIHDMLADSDPTLFINLFEAGLQLDSHMPDDNDLPAGTNRMRVREFIEQDANGLAKHLPLLETYNQQFLDAKLAVVDRVQNRAAPGTTPVPPVVTPIPPQPVQPASPLQPPRSLSLVAMSHDPQRFHEPAVLSERDSPLMAQQFEASHQLRGATGRTLPRRPESPEIQPAHDGLRHRPSSSSSNRAH